MNLKINSFEDLKKEGKSFYWASFFLPKKSRINAGTLYSVCRYFDDIADKDNNDQSEFLKSSINNIKQNKQNEVGIFLQKNKISNLIFFDLIEGLIADQRETAINNQDQLIKYSYHVAGTVGLMMSKIIGVTNKKAKPCAIDLGIAMQITNIARDVHEDAQMQRIYIPSEWIPNISLSILSGKNEIKLEQEELLSNAIHKLINLSEKFYMNGFSGLRYIPIKTRLGILIAANIYRGIGIKIKKHGKKYLKRRIYLNGFEKFIITLKSILIFFFIPILYSKYNKIRETLPNENL